METSVQGTLGSERSLIFKITRGKNNRVKSTGVEGCFLAAVSSHPVSCPARTLVTWSIVSGDHSSLLSPPTEAPEKTGQCYTVEWSQFRWMTSFFLPSVHGETDGGSQVLRRRAIFFGV